MKKWLPEELEEIPCDFCGSREVSREFMRVDGMRVIECAKCGLAYLNPRPKPEFIPKLYEADYFTGAAAERGEGGLACNLDPKTERQPTDEVPRLIAIVNKRFGGFGGKDVLEIGCAIGDLLLRINNDGARAQGLEISDFAAEVARKRGLDVTTGTVEDFVKGNEEKFDIVLALEVIEHVLSPTRFFEHASRLLKPGGLLLISTPNYACVKRFDRAWLGLATSFEHIYFYSLPVLTKITARLNLQQTYVESSRSMGASQAATSARRQIERIKTILYLWKNLGFVNTVRALGTASKGYYPYAIGHTLFVVLRKELRPPNVSPKG